MLYPALLRFFSKREGQIHSNFDKQMFVHLACIQLKVVLLVLRTVFAVGFWLLSFLQLKLWARIPLQIGDSPSAVFLELCVNSHNVLALHFKVTNLTSYKCSEFYGHDWLQNCRYKTRESSEAYLLKLEKNLSKGLNSKLFTFFVIIRF